MVQKTSLLALVVGLLVASSFVGAAAFTSATVERDATVGVSADSSALVGLEAGEVDGVSESSDGELEIELGAGNGLNIESTFTFGDSDSPSGTYAFAMANNGDSSQQYTVDYVQASNFADSDADANLEFNFYNSDGTALTGTQGSDVVITEDGNGQSFSLASGETVYVVISVDTQGLTKSDDLSGDIEITT
jgi:hypothetical protein